MPLDRQQIPGVIWRPSRGTPTVALRRRGKPACLASGLRAQSRLRRSSLAACLHGKASWPVFGHMPAQPHSPAGVRRDLVGLHSLKSAFVGTIIGWALFWADLGEVAAPRMMPLCVSALDGCLARLCFAPMWAGLVALDGQLGPRVDRSTSALWVRQPHWHR